MRGLPRLTTGILLVTGLLLIVPLTTGHVPLGTGLWALATIFSTIGLVHAAARDGDRRLTAGLLVVTVVFFLGFLGSLGPIDLPSFDLDWLPGLPSLPVPIIVPTSFLPSWWVAVFFVPTVLVILMDLAGLFDDHDPIDRPASEGPTYTPLQIGAALAVLGLWGTLLATGISFLQKALVFAPIFEEMLKFGVALAIGLLIEAHGRPTYVAIALAAGAAFGVVEHFYTYASEGDLGYLVRVVFHATTAAVSMGACLRILGSASTPPPVAATAPIWSIVVHGANNTMMIPVALIEHAYGTSLGPTVSILLLVPLILLVLFLPRRHLLAIHRTVTGFLGLPTTGSTEEDEPFRT